MFVACLQVGKLYAPLDAVEPCTDCFGNYIYDFIDCSNDEVKERAEVVKSIRGFCSKCYDIRPPSVAQITMHPVSSLKN